MTELFIISLLVIAVLVWFFFFRGNTLERRAKNNTSHKALPSGVNVRVEHDEPYPNVLAVEQTVLDFIEKAYDKGYRLNRGDVAIAFLKPDGIHNGIPIFEIKSGSYERSEFDKGDKMKIAGQYFPPSLIVLPSQTDIGQLREILRHELLHWCYWVADRPKYEATKHHNGSVFEL